MPPGPHDAHEAKPQSWTAMPHRVRTIARPPTVGSPRPPLWRLLIYIIYIYIYIRIYIPLGTSPPPRSARLGSTTSTGRLTSTSSTPTPSDLQSDSPPPTAPLHPTAPNPDVQAAAAHLSNTLLNYSHSDWDNHNVKTPSATQPTDTSNSAVLNTS